MTDFFDVNNLPVEHPAAAFLVMPQPWSAKAACNGASSHIFFDDTEVASPIERHEAIEYVRATFCAGCPARIECGEQAMLEEGGADESGRFGFRAGMTPQQRVSVHRRGGLLGRDPLLVIAGVDGDRDVPPVPNEGDRWSRHHTTLARKVVARITDNLVIGEPLPNEAAMARLLDTHPQPLKRVLDALVQDGTLDVHGKGRNRRYVMRGTARAVSWLPLHLRHTTDN